MTRPDLGSDRVGVGGLRSSDASARDRADCAARGLVEGSCAGGASPRVAADAASDGWPSPWSVPPTFSGMS